jgi:surface protein
MIKNSFIFTIFLIILLFFTACGDSSTDGSHPTFTNNYEITAVDGYIKEATIHDSLGHVAAYIENGKYIFTSEPTYPLTLTGGALEATNVPLDINMSLSSENSLVISPITTFLGNNSSMLDVFSNLDLGKVSFEDYSVDYIDTNDSNLAKLSQLLYVVLRDENLTETFKQTLINTNPSSLDELFTLAEVDINNSKNIGSEEKIISRQILTLTKSFTGSANTMETYLQESKEKMAFVNEHGNPFVMQWKINSYDYSVDIYIDSTYSYDYIIDWGDGEISNNINGSSYHSYSYSTEDINYTVKIYGEFPAIQLQSDSKLMNISSWGDIKWQSMEYAFNGCINLESNASDKPDLSNVTSLRGMFRNATKFNTDIGDWNTSNVTNMAAMFQHADNFNHDISLWDTSQVTNMAVMFNCALNFNQDISSWDTSNVISMHWMFAYAYEFNQDISSWNTSNVTDMSNMFDNASSFSNQDLTSWNVINVGSHTDFMTSSGSGNSEPNW